MKAVLAHTAPDLPVVDPGVGVSEATPGGAFWYENSVGLVEIAVNQGSAARSLGLQVGSVIAMPK